MIVVCGPRRLVVTLTTTPKTQLAKTNSNMVLKLNFFMICITPFYIFPKLISVEYANYVSAMLKKSYYVIK
ncbi:hypothetical protein C7M37_00606 [Lactiplantibacillus plantarum]|nr:hypothetical protein ADS73_08825 [Lactiplantibacillus plantarum]QHM39617.1 hypothetical protein C7M37_00606 [Lactiplantibacillus plantarum]